MVHQPARSSMFVKHPDHHHHHHGELMIIIILIIRKTMPASTSIPLKHPDSGLYGRVQLGAKGVHHLRVIMGAGCFGSCCCY